MREREEKQFVTEPQQLIDFDFVYLKNIAEYQFGQDIASCLFPDKSLFFIQRSLNTWRIRNILNNDNSLYLILRAQDNLFSLTEISANIIKDCSKPPAFRVIISNDIGKIIREGGNVFSKHVINVDKRLRAGDDVIIVNEEDELIAYGRMKISGEETIEYKRGVAVNVKGRLKNGNNT
jgi:uncharacterized protein with predicted RNA binding PUA domain